MHEILENFEKKGYVEKLFDGITKQTRYKVTDKGVAAYLRWEPVMSEWEDFEF
jgi:DNA-binding MarR family transcriptional regulator